MQQTQHTDPRVVDTTWTAQEAPIVAQRRSNYLPALREPTKVAQPAPFEGFNVPAPAQSLVELRTTYTDRSKGFLWATTPLAIVTSILATIAGVALFSVPLLSWSLLQVFMVTFCLTWAVAYLAHLGMSPDGALLLNSLQLWRTVSREQEFRHDRYWQEYTDSRRDAGLDVRPASRRRR